MKKKRNNKAKSCSYKGKSFPSKTERECYIQLLELVSDGIIIHLKLQPVLRFVLPDGREMRSYTKRTVLQYTPDFGAIDTQTGKDIYYEAKGFARGEFKLRFAVARALYPDARFVLFTMKKGFEELT